MEPTVAGTAGVAPTEMQAPPTLQMWIELGDKVFFDDVIKMHKSQSKKDADSIKYYVNLFKNGEFKEGTGASANFTFSDVSLLMAVLLARDPNIVVNPSNAGDLPSLDVLMQMGIAMDPVDAADKYARMLEDVQTFVWSDTKTSDHVAAALFNAICTGIGYCKVGYDTAKQTSRVDALNRDEVFVDPMARYQLAQAQYVSICCVMEVKAAQAFFDSIGCQYKVDGNFKLSEGENLAADMAKNEPEGDGKTKRYFRFYEIWRKNPDGSRVVYYRNYTKDEDWFFSRPWPYMLDTEEFPVVELVFNRQYQSAQDPFTDLCVVNGLRKAYENVVEFYRSHVMRGIASKVIYNKSAFKEQDLTALLSSDDFEAIGAEGVAVDQDLSQVVKVINFTEDASVVIELADSLKSIKDEIFGISEMQRAGGGKKYTAEQARIQNDWTSARVDRRQALLDEFMERILSIRTKIDLLLCPDEKIGAIAGPNAAMMWSIFDGNLEELKCQYSIKIAAGSTGQAAKQKKIESMERAYKLMQAENAASPTGPLYNTPKIVEELLTLYELPHPERFIMAPPPMMPMQPGMEQQGPNVGVSVSVDPNDPNAQGAMGAGPGGAQPPLPTMPGESELGSQVPA